MRTPYGESIFNAGVKIAFQPKSTNTHTYTQCNSLISSPNHNVTKSAYKP